MSKNESLKPHGQRGTQSVLSAAEDWGRQFVKHLELEYTTIASELPTVAASSDFRRAIFAAVLKVLSDSGATTEEVFRLLHESARELPSTEGTVEWTSELNARRLTLIDRWIQKTLSPDEAVELEQLTQQMRKRFDTEEMVPLEGARRLHRQLLGMDDPEPPSTRSVETA